MGLSDKALVVKSDLIFNKGRWQGLKMTNLNHYLNLIEQEQQFIVRSEIEEDPSWQQIIPYIVFKYQQQIFLYRYLSGSSETRLRKDYMIGIGGHLDPADSEGGQVVETGLWREWREEIDYQGKITNTRLIGVLNDDTRLVEQVHLGLVYLFEGDSPHISVKETDVLAGGLVPGDELANYLDVQGSGWANLIYRDFLKDLFASSHTN